MPHLVMLQTERLILRPWRDEDRAPFAAMNADARVMEHFPSVLSREESDTLVDRLVAHDVTHGYTFWAVEVLGVTPFAGFVGLLMQTFEAPFTPAIEVGWRLAVEHWGNGYATEGARASLAHAFDVVGAPEVVSMTVPGNVRSRHVMEKLGMTRDPRDDFDHPRIPEGHPMRRCVLYRVARPT